MAYGPLSLFDPLRSKALVAYSRLLPLWAHPFIDLLEPYALLAGAYTRLVLLDAVISLSVAAFIRVLLGQLVPAESIGTIVLVGIAFAMLNLLNSRLWQPAHRRLQLAIYSRIYARVRREILPNLFHPRRLAFLGTETANSSVAAPARAATLCSFTLLPLISDVPAIILTIGVFLLLAGWSYAPLLLIYALYVGGDLFLSYARRQAQTAEGFNPLAKSLLRIYSLNKKSFDDSHLFQWVSPLVFSAASRDVDAQLIRAGQSEEEIVGTQNTADLISVILLVFVTTLVMTSATGSGQLLAGILVLMRLTPMVKKAYVDYTTLRVEALGMRWFEGVYADVKKENQSLASRTLPVGQIGPVRTVQLRNVSLRIPTPKVPSSSPQLVSVNVTFSAGELVAVVGRSGSSKSTLLRVLTGVYPLSSGQCLINGYDVQQLSEEELRHRVVYLDADSCQLPDELLKAMDEPPQCWGGRWTSNLIEQLMSSEGLLVALDQPELWLEEADASRSYRDTLLALANRHLLVVSTRDEPTLQLADRMLVMEAAVCNESQEFRASQVQKKAALISAQPQS